MKKSLLTLGLAFTFGLGFAQTTFTIFDGTSAGASQGNPYVFAGAAVEVDTLPALPEGKFIYLHYIASDTGGYGGGSGIAKYNPGLQPLGYAGTVAGTALQFVVNTNGSDAQLKIQFKTASGKQFGYQWDFTDSTDAKTKYALITLPLTSLRLLEGDGFSTTPVADSLLQTATSEVQFVFPKKSVEVNIGEIVLVDGFTTDVQDQSIYTFSTIFPNPCTTGVLHLGETAKSFTLSNMAGVTVKQGLDNKINVSDLEKGIYFVRVGDKSSKVIIN